MRRPSYLPYSDPGLRLAVPHPGLQKIVDFFGWTRHSLYMMAGFLVTLLLIVVIWWPLYQEVLDFIEKYNIPWTALIDWLLIGIFLAMSLLITRHADFRQDWLIIVVGLFGGLAIEGWGTQTELWRYYTAERPPLWIIPAWPVASLCIDRLMTMLDGWLPPGLEREFQALHWLVYPAFYVLMLLFVWPTLDKSLTVAALVACALMIIKPVDARAMVLAFVAGAGLGYFLELWGTTRLTWMYYTGEQPPLFAVLAHGMAAAAFWRAAQIVRLLLANFNLPISIPTLGQLPDTD